MPCCGATEADVAGMFDKAAAFRAAPEGLMARVYSVRIGHALSVAQYGVAYNETPLVVPASVGLELEALTEDGAPVFRVEWPDGEREAAVAAPAPETGVATPESGAPADATDGQSEPFHADGGKVHHNRTDCTQGNDIEKPIPGDGGLPECPKCKKLAKASAKE